MKDKEFYRQEIIKIISGINRTDVLECFYVYVYEVAKGVGIDVETLENRD
jgi:hypothetical protein